ncbi:BON domain-containing protein [Streptomyces sp. JNUCC 63]
MEIDRDVLARTLGLTPADVRLSVTDGRVALEGAVQARSPIPVIEVIERLCGGVDGVMSVNKDTIHRSDGTRGHAHRV